MRLFILSALMIVISAANAGVYKCKSGTQVVYSDAPCPNAKPVDVTNGKAPTKIDAARAEWRKEKDKIKLTVIEAEAQLEKLKQQRCNQMARDHAWRQSNVAKYPNDKWWKNREMNSRDSLNNECKGYLAP